MAGFGLLGDSWQDPRSAANMGLAAGLLRGDFAGGLLASQDGFMQAQQAAAKQKYLDAQMQEMQAMAQARELEMRQKQAEAQRQEGIRQGMPSLFRQPGMAGGEAVPQMEGGVPMFSRPLQAAPMQSTPGGFDLNQAFKLNMTPKEIQEAAALANVGRAKVARTVKGMGPDGREFEYQVDEFGQRVGEGLPQYRAPISINQGDRTTFADPYSLKPVGSFGVNQSPDSRASNALGWANHSLSRQRLALDNSNAQAGKWQYDATRGGLVNMQTGEFKPAMQNGQPVETKASKEAAQAEVRQKSALAQADSVLKEIRDAKGMVGWNTAGVGGAMAVLPATEARDLSGKLQTVKANLGFDRLQQMRAESPTGGALGGVAIQELVALQSTVASLDQMQSPAQLGQALDKIEKHYTNWKNIVQQSRAPQGGASGGWGIREKK